VELASELLEDEEKKKRIKKRNKLVDHLKLKAMTYLFYMLVALFINLNPISE
jgi:hypothetical protein